MGREAQYLIIEDDFARSSPLVIQDVGPWDQHLTVTNDAEGVVERLVESGELSPGRRLFCIDSNGDKDELVVKDGRFAGFAPGPK
jgi:hypothetical protein